MDAKLWMLTAALAGGTWSCANTESASTESTEAVASHALALSDGSTSGNAATNGVDLVARGSLSGNQADRSSRTSAVLENGVAGNLLGGIGSGLAYAGFGQFLALPDRGPNAVAYNPAIDDTASYINRFQSLALLLTHSAKGAALPLTLTPALEATTLLYASTPLAYGVGGAAFGGVAGGAPALNDRGHYYLSGRSDNFDASLASTAARQGRLDPESIRVSNDGLYVFISDEYGPYIYQFERFTGRRVRAFELPSDFAVTKLRPQGAAEIGDNTVGRVANKGMEGLAISPDGKTLFGAMQSPLLQDGATNGKYSRIIEVDIQSGATTQYVYALTNIGTDAKPKYPTISDIVAINDHEFLVDERDGAGLGDNSTAKFKRVYHIDLAGATDASGLEGQAALASHAVPKTLFLDIVSVLNAHGIASTDIPAKLEGLTFGPDVFLGGARKHTLFVANDNDFLGTITDTNHPNGIDNPNQFFVFAFDDSQLPGFQRQRLLGWQLDVAL